MSEYCDGDVVRLKKKHPCGSFEWKIAMVGAEYRLECCGCGHRVLMTRNVLKKSVKEIIRN